MADSTDDTIETAMRHVGDPGTAEIVAPGEGKPEFAAAAAGVLHGSDPGGDTGTGATQDPDGAPDDEPPAS